MAKTKDKQGRLRKRRILKPNVITSQFNDAIEEFNNDSNEVPMSESMVIEPDLAQGNLLRGIEKSSGPLEGPLEGQLDAIIFFFFISTRKHKRGP